MTFAIQSPGTAKLIDAINDAARNSEHGGGVFAFASREGVKQFLEAPAIRQMLEHGKPLEIVVGVDMTTNAETLLFLEEKMEEYTALVANAFSHNRPLSTFHPKFCWFKRDNCLYLITGSGNLTNRGLGRASTGGVVKGNWEAFTYQELLGDQAEHAERVIREWLDEQRTESALVPVSDPRVQAKAIENGRVRLVPARPPRGGSSEPQPEPTHDAETTRVKSHYEANEVLLRELGKNRPGQADVGKRVLEDFFGYQEDLVKYILLQYVELDDTLHKAEKVNLFENQSRNYRLELNGMRGHGYDIASNDGRLVLVAVKLDHRSFRYTLVPVNDENYASMESILGPVPTGRRKMREKTVSIEVVKDVWPEAPSFLLPIDSPTTEV